MQEPTREDEERFEILSELGRGGMGVVYRALDRHSGREVALKVSLEVLSGTRLERFQREGQVSAALRHDGIVSIHSAGLRQGRPYLAYELVEGESLEAARERLGLAEQVGAIRDAARALGYAHSQGIVHRDVKEENVLIASSGRVLVADFGIAMAQDLERLTLTGATPGTPTHMSPEQVAGGRDEVGPPTDVWALGVMLYRALTGEFPFEADSLVQLAGKIVSASPQRPSEVGADVPPGLEAICLRALRRDPGDRYAEGEALARALDDWLAGKRTRSGTPGLVIGGVWGLIAALSAAAVWGAGTPTAPSPHVSPARISSPPASDLPPASTPSGAAVAVKHAPTGLTVGVFLDDTTLLTRDERAIRAWDVRAPRAPLWSLPAAGQVQAIAAASKGDKFIVGHGLALLVVDAATREVVQEIALEQVAMDVAIAASGDVLTALAGSSNLLITSSPFVGAWRPIDHSSLRVLAISRDGKLVAGGGGVVYTASRKSDSASFVGVWNTRRGEQILYRNLPGVNRALAWSKSGRLAVGTDSGHLLLLDPIRSARPLLELRGEGLKSQEGWVGPPAHEGEIRGVVFSEDERRLFSVSTRRKRGAVRGELRVWSLPGGQELHRLDLTIAPTCAELSPSGSRLAVGTLGGEVWLYDVQRLTPPF